MQRVSCGFLRQHKRAHHKGEHIWEGLKAHPQRNHNFLCDKIPILGISAIKAILALVRVLPKWHPTTIVIYDVSAELSK